MTFGVTSPLIAACAAEERELARRVAESGAAFPVCPRATAVAGIFVAKLRRQGTEPAAVPLEELVTPATLEKWTELFEDPEARAAAVEYLRNYQLVTPVVRPQPDGSTLVMFAWTHPDQHVSGPAPRQAVVINVRLRLVENPDDWRVERID